MAPHSRLCKRWISCTLFIASALAPCSAKRRATSPFWHSQATWLEKNDAPWSKRSTKKWFMEEQRNEAEETRTYSGVFSNLSKASTFAPFSSRNLQILACPCDAALCKGVLPVLSFAFTDAPSSSSNSAIYKKRMCSNHSTNQSNQSINQSIERRKTPCALQEYLNIPWPWTITYGKFILGCSVMKRLLSRVIRLAHIGAFQDEISN